MIAPMIWTTKAESNRNSESDFRCSSTAKCEIRTSVSRGSGKENRVPSERTRSEGGRPLSRDDPVPRSVRPTSPAGSKTELKTP